MIDLPVQRCHWLSDGGSIKTFIPRERLLPVQRALENKSNTDLPMNWFVSVSRSDVAIMNFEHKKAFSNVVEREPETSCPSFCRCFWLWNCGVWNCGVWSCGVWNYWVWICGAWSCGWGLCMFFSDNRLICFLISLFFFWGGLSKSLHSESELSSLACSQLIV